MLHAHTKKSSKWSDKHNSSVKKHRSFNKYKNKILVHIYNIYDFWHVVTELMFSPKMA